MATKKDKKTKKSSAMVAASKARSAVNAVIPDSSGAVSGSSDLANTGPAVSYKNKE